MNKTLLELHDMFSEVHCRYDNIPPWEDEQETFHEAVEMIDDELYDKDTAIVLGSAP